MVRAPIGCWGGRRPRHRTPIDGTSHDGCATGTPMAARPRCVATGSGVSPAWRTSGDGWRHRSSPSRQPPVTIPSMVRSDSVVAYVGEIRSGSEQTPCWLADTTSTHSPSATPTPCCSWMTSRRSMSKVNRIRRSKIGPAVPESNECRVRRGPRRRRREGPDMGTREWGRPRPRVRVQQQRRTLPIPIEDVEAPGRGPPQGRDADDLVRRRRVPGWKVPPRSCSAGRSSIDPCAAESQPRRRRTATTTPRISTPSVNTRSSYASFSGMQDHRIWRSLEGLDRCLFALDQRSNDLPGHGRCSASGRPRSRGRRCRRWPSSRRGSGA